MTGDTFRKIGCQCGFTVQGLSEDGTKEIFEGHRCPEESHWYGAAFSVWGFLIVFVFVLIWGTVLMVRGDLQW